MLIDLIVHCFRFSRVLNYQLSSLVHYSAWPAEVSITIFYDPDDQPTTDVINHFRPDVTIAAWALPRRQLLRREIGRNLAAHQTAADVVWFADADYYFGDGCLSALAGTPLADGMIHFPRKQQISKTHKLGDIYALRAKSPGLYDVNPADFQTERIRKAIGGLQIVTGDTARKHGYCDGCKVQAEVDPANGWVTTLGDRVYRGESGLNCGKGTPIDLPNLYRIRQSQQGVVDELPIPAGDQRGQIGIA